MDKFRGSYSVKVRDVGDRLAVGAVKTEKNE